MGYNLATLCLTPYISVYRAEVVRVGVFQLHVFELTREGSRTGFAVELAQN